MKNVICTLFIMFFGFFSYAAPIQSKFPQVTSWQSSPQLQMANHKKVLLKKNEPLKSSFVVVTKANDQAEILFSDGEILRIGPNSRVQVPHVTEGGAVSEIFILDGKVQIQTESLKSNSRIRLKSAFFDIELPANLNLVVVIDSKKPSATLELIKGELTAAFFDFEKTQNLKAGESVAFVGENDESGQVKYDYLLNNKKAPHGVLKEKESFDAEVYIQKEKEILKSQKLEEEKLKRAEALQIQKQKKRKDSFLCHGPDGKLDQCFWKKESTLCFRFRCNAEGKWGDKTERPMNENCETAPVAVRCDY